MNQRSRTLRYGLSCLALIVLYAVVPVRAEPEPAVLVLRLVASAAMLAVIAIAIGRLALRQLRDPDAPFGGLVVGIVAGLLFFALVDYTIAVYRPGEFTGLTTRVDGVYFALSTLLTVGYGDVAAQGQIARAVVSAQMVFNFTALAGSASLIARRLTDRARRAPRR